MPDLERLESTLSSIHWTFRYYDERVKPWTLLNGLRISLPCIDADTWPERLEWGGVYVNGRMKTSDMELPVPCLLEYFEPKYPFEKRMNFYPLFSSSWILFSDDDVAVVYKPAGLPCLPSREQRHLHLKGYVESHFRQRLHMPSRLDTSTAGMLVMSRSSRMNKHLQQAFEYRRVAKYYLFETGCRPEWTERLVEASIAKDHTHPILRKVDTHDGKEAKTIFTLIHEAHDRFLIRAKPMTGRTHQIRTHAAYIGIPVTGDNFYEGRHAEELRLLSYHIEFHNPFNEAPCAVTLPREFWPEWALPARDLLLAAAV